MDWTKILLASLKPSEPSARGTRMYSSSLAIAVQSNGSRFGATVVAYCGNGTNGEGKSGGLQKW